MSYTYMKWPFWVVTVFACFCCTYSYAQNSYTIKGITADSASMAQLTATITVLNAKDSVLVKYTRAGNGGVFSLDGLPAGKFLILVTYPDYADYVETFTLGSQNIGHDFGNINMQLKTSLLKEVLIKGQTNEIKIKGDTTEFNAKAYVIQPNSKVEDLLKQFPGIEIDRAGKITANGEKVNKVLLDGEEFFGDDPTLITRNIRGDMVEKVQLYDKKTDQAAFTGVDDGKKIKTLNVILKEDRKSGTFGKVDAGAATHDYYEGQGIYNEFKAKNKFSAYGTTSNDGVTGLGNADNSKLGISSAANISDDGGTIAIGSFDQLDLSDFGGIGSPLSRSGGVHYDGKWNKDVDAINANYRIASLDVNTDRTTISQQYLPTGVLDKNSVSNTYNYNFRQKLDAVFQYTPNIATSLKITVDGAIRENDSRVNGTSITTDGAGVLKNDQISGLNNKNHDKFIDAIMFYSKRLKKAGRTFTWNVNGIYDEATANDYINSSLYTAVNSTTVVTDQYKPSTGTMAIVNSNATYTEPITQKLLATVNYGLGLNNSSSDQESFNQSAPGRYDVLDTAFSNNYKFNQLSNQIGLNFNYRPAQKIIVLFGNTSTAVNYNQIDENTGTVYKRDYVRWAPRASIQYNIATSQTFSLGYSGYNSEPNIGQIQPVKVNTDLTNIIIGNPDLKASFYQTFSARYSRTKSVVNSYFGISGSYSFVQSQIIVNTLTDVNTGKSTTQYVNLIGKDPYNFNLYVTSSWRTMFLNGSHVYINFAGRGGTNYNYINGDLNTTTSQACSLNLRITRALKNVYSTDVSIAPGYNFYRYSLQPDYNNNSFGLGSRDNVLIYVTKKLLFTTTLDYTYAAKTPSLPAAEYTLWDASFGRTFLKEDNLKIALSGNNILNQSRNNRSQVGSTINQTYTNTIGRYFMLTVTWDFTKFGTTAPSAK
jgi:hypothetical protein